MKGGDIMEDKDKKAMQKEQKNPDANVEAPKEQPLDKATLQDLVAREKLARAYQAKAEIDAVLKKHGCILTATAFIRDNGTIGAVAKVDAV